MQILVNSLDGQVNVYDVAENTTVGNIKGQLSAEGVLSFGGKVMDDDAALLSSFAIQHGSTLDFSGRLLGGKVHGSLARAGKVRAQTPKVEKQEKKKKKTGRAARRIQYNRRFVNVATQGPGRKRGPNSNS